MKFDSTKARILHVMDERKIETANEITPYGSDMYPKVYRQLFSERESDKEVSLDVAVLFSEKFDDISADWLFRGEGSMERTKIVVPPTHRQDIHVEQGATAAISQSGSASATPSPAHADEKKSDTFTYEDVARMVRDNDLGGLVGIIFAQQQQIIRYEQQRNADLIREIRIVDDKLFPDVK